MNYCHVVMYTYHKTYEVKAKVHTSFAGHPYFFAIYHFYQRFMDIHESRSDMMCILEHWEMMYCPSKYLIPIKPSKAMSSRDISDFVGLSLHFSLIFSYL